MLFIPKSILTHFKIIHRRQRPELTMEESGEKKGTAKKKHLDNNLSGVDKAVGILGYKNSITTLLIFSFVVSM